MTDVRPQSMPRTSVRHYRREPLGQSPRPDLPLQLAIRVCGGRFRGSSWCCLWSGCVKRNVIRTGLQPRLTNVSRGCDPSSPVPSHERSVSPPRFRAWLDCRPFHSRSYFTCSGSSRILIESVPGRKSYLDRDLHLGPATATLL